MKFKIIMLFIIAITTTKVNAQVRTNFNNTERVSARGKFNNDYFNKPFIIEAPDLNDAYAKEKAEEATGSKIIFIAKAISTKIDVSQLASWTEVGKMSFGKFTITTKDAKTLSINFSNFNLPKGTEMYIYNRDAEMITGAITENENNKNKVWGSSIYKGEEISIEIRTPTLTKSELSLIITNVAYGYKNIFIEKTAGFGQSGPCNINVLCPQGTGWEAERNSVAFIAHSNGNALCSGSMLMNSCATNIPYLLTANHCFVGDNDVAGWRVFFQAWSPTCVPSANNDGILFNGSTLRANWAQSDFCLVQLNQTPPVNSGIHYAGWSRSTVAATNGVGIHHPAGDVMKISTYTTPLIRADNPNLCGVVPISGLSWVVNWNSGVTEGGSSGSPLFDQNHRIVGQLGGGPSSCTAAAGCRTDGYGRFDNSWTGGGTNATRLSNWLDPANSGAVTTNTTNILNLVTPGNLTLNITGGSSPICANGSTSTYTLNGAPAGVNIIWTISNPAIASLTSVGNQATVTKTGTGTITLTATVGSVNCFPINTATQTISLGIVPVVPSFTPSGSSYWTNIPNPPSTIYGTGCFTGSNKGMTFTYSGVTNLTAFPLNNNSYPYVVGNTVAWNYPIGVSPGLLRVGYNNGCGQVDQILSISTYCTGFAFTVNPNPANSDVTISPKNEVASKTQTINENLKEINIYDLQGNLMKRYKYNKTKTAKINVSNLISGTYFIELVTEKNTERQQLIIQK
jgi:lysyl endopeptidase